MIAITLEKAPEEVGEKGGIQMRIPLQLNTAPIRRLGRTGVTDPARRNDNGQMLEQCFTEVSRDFSDRPIDDALAKQLVPGPLTQTVDQMLGNAFATGMLAHGWQSQQRRVLRMPEERIRRPAFGEPLGQGIDARLTSIVDLHPEALPCLDITKTRLQHNILTLI